MVEYTRCPKCKGKAKVFVQIRGMRFVTFYLCKCGWMYSDDGGFT